MEQLEFETTTLSSFFIEDKITYFYDIGYSHTSNFGELELGIHRDYHIMASKGSIDFSATVGKSANGKGYTVVIRPLKIKKSR